MKKQENYLKIIAEDKILILITLLLAKIMRDILSGEQNNKYLIYVPESVYKKKNKFEKMMSMLDDEISKNSILC